MLLRPAPNMEITSSCHNCAATHLASAPAEVAKLMHTTPTQTVVIAMDAADRLVPSFVAPEHGRSKVNTVHPVFKAWKSSAHT